MASSSALQPLLPLPLASLRTLTPFSPLFCLHSPPHTFQTPILLLSCFMCIRLTVHGEFAPLKAKDCEGAEKIEAVEGLAIEGLNCSDKHMYGGFIAGGVKAKGFSAELMCAGALPLSRGAGPDTLSAGHKGTQEELEELLGVEDLGIEGFRAPICGGRAKLTYSGLDAMATTATSTLNTSSPSAESSSLSSVLPAHATLFSKLHSVLHRRAVCEVSFPNPKPCAVDYQALMSSAAVMHNHKPLRSPGPASQIVF